MRETKKDNEHHISWHFRCNVFPPTVNKRYGHKNSTRWMDFRKSVADEIFQNSTTMLDDSAFYHELTVSLIFHPPTDQRRDVDNFIKPTLDALTAAGIWQDDCLVKTVIATMSTPDIKGVGYFDVSITEATQWNYRLTGTSRKGVAEGI